MIVEEIMIEETVTTVEDLMIGNMIGEVMMAGKMREEIVMITETLTMVRGIHLGKEGGVMIMITAVLGKICTEDHITVGGVLQLQIGTVQRLMIIQHMRHNSTAIHHTLILSPWTFINISISCTFTSFILNTMNSIVPSLVTTTWVTRQSKWHNITEECTTPQDTQVHKPQSKV